MGRLYKTLNSKPCVSLRKLQLLVYEGLPLDTFDGEL